MSSRTVDDKQWERLRRQTREWLYRNGRLPPPRPDGDAGRHAPSPASGAEGTVADDRRAARAGRAA